MATSIVQHCACAHCGGGFDKPITSPPTNTKYCSVACRFWAKVDTSGGADACWPWTAARCDKGYGRFIVSTGVADGSHRVAYRLTKGEIPAGLCVCHRCDNPWCCNPAHHFLGTHRDNMMDMLAKGRQVTMGPELIERLRQMKIGKPRSQEVRAKLSAAGMGKEPWNKGKKAPQIAAAKRAWWAKRKLLNAA